MELGRKPLFLLSQNKSHLKVKIFFSETLAQVRNNLYLCLINSQLKIIVMTNLVPLWPNLSRAYEIALLGNFSITIFYYKDYIASASDYNDIKSFFNDVRFEKEGDLIIDIEQPDPKIVVSKRKYETLEEIRARVEKAKNNFLPTEYNSATEQLLMTAIQKMKLSVNKKDKTENLAAIIAKLDGSKTILIEHMAEAINYSYSGKGVFGEKVVNAEANTIHFGSGISISLHDHYHVDVENAIKFLLELIGK